MSWSFRHEFGVTFRLDEHGGDAEERHEALYERCIAQMAKAVADIASDCEYAEIVVEYPRQEPV